MARTTISPNFESDKHYYRARRKTIMAFKLIVSELLRHTGPEFAPKPCTPGVSKHFKAALTQPRYQ